MRGGKQNSYDEFSCLHQSQRKIVLRRARPSTPVPDEMN